MKPVKIALLSLAIVGLTGVLMNSTSFSQEQNEYVGQAGCAMCHPDQAKQYEGNAHAALPHSCEECHGPGHLHAAAGPANLRKMQEEKKSLLINVPKTYADCGSCHKRNEDLSITMVSDFVLQSSQEYPEMMQNMHSDPVARGMNCTYCHSPHIPVNAEKGMKRSCKACHTGKTYGMEIAIEGMKGLACEDCHMPMAVTKGQAETTGEYQHGDIRSHLFGISVDPAYKISDGSGKALKNADGKVQMTVEMACYPCHKTGKSTDMTREALLQWAAKVHPAK